MAFPWYLSEVGKPHMQFYIVNELNKKVLDIRESDGSEGAKVTTWGKKNPTSKSQLWYIDKEGNIRSALNNFVPLYNGHGKQVTMHSFNGNLNQKWRFEGQKIKCRNDGCLVIEHANVNDGANIIAISYNGTPNEKWTAEYVRFYIVSELNKKVIDIQGGEASAGAKIIMNKKSDPVSKNQLWYIDDQAVIRSDVGDFALTAPAKAEPVTVNPFNGDVNQQWRFLGQMIINDSGLYLDVKGSIKTDGAIIITWDHNGESNQLFSSEIA